MLLADNEDEGEAEGGGVFTISTWSILLLLSFCTIIVIFGYYYLLENTRG
jgi:hypothetical protein